MKYMLLLWISLFKAETEEELEKIRKDQRDGGASYEPGNQCILYDNCLVRVP